MAERADGGQLLSGLIGPLLCFFLDFASQLPVMEGPAAITVERIALSRQIDSFEEDPTGEVLSNGRQRPLPGIFIRAPRLVAARPALSPSWRMAPPSLPASSNGSSPPSTRSFPTIYASTNISPKWFVRENCAA